MINLIPTLAHRLDAVVIDNLHQAKQQIVQWAAGFPYAQVLDNCQSEVDRYGEYELLVGVSSKNATYIGWEAVREAVGGKWLMGGIAYESKNIFEPKLSSRPEAAIEVPEACFFEPETVICIRRGSNMLEVLGDPQGIKEALKRKPRKPVLSSSPLFSSNFSKAEYLRTVRALQQHIEEGDCYEINLSQIFTAKQRLELPEDIFLKLLDISPVPFAAMLKWDSYWLLCASPERFLQKKEDIIRTQPIKGTAARDKRSAQDKQNKAALRHSPKEQAENVMIVDLSRNDIYRVCKTNTVRVPDLFEIQAFPTVYQIVSTIEGRLDPSIGEVDIIEHIFPPGSMTGAPKVRTMELIDAYESDGRGMYAGSVGYFSPDGNFDFNVVIRALQYDDLQGKLAYQVGGAITWDSDPEAEYEETLLKAAAIRKIWE